MTTSHSKEPWSLVENGSDVRIQDATGRIVADPVANEDGISTEDKQRIVACVNALCDWTTERLIEHARSIIPLPIDVPDGDVLAQARAWRRVWAALWELGMGKFFGGTMKGGADRAVEFIQELGRRSQSLRDNPAFRPTNYKTQVDGYDTSHPDYREELCGICSRHICQCATLGLR